MMVHRRVLLAITLFSSITFADDPLRPLRITTPPVIDGDLSDEVWTLAPRVRNFKTFIPDFGKAQDQATEAAMAYDRENLYFAFWCYDDPNLVKTTMAARDNNRSDDWVCINLDTFGDQQGLYAIYVNPSGIQSDSRFAGGNEDFSADMVWYSAGRMTDDGYRVEIQLPLKSFRYADSDSITMTVFFERYVSRTSEHGSYPELDPKKGYAFLSQMAPMVYTGLEHYTLLEILPSFVFNEQRSHRDGLFALRDSRREASLTAKYGITSDLVLDATYNPDFSQVEADAGQVDVNLRFNLFYPEKRPFFLEGREYFALGGTEAASPIRELVHTRTIVDPVVGLKLSGKLGRQNVVSAIYAKDELPSMDPAFPTSAQFLVARYRRTLDDDSFLGAIFTDREFGSSFNRVGGFDAKVRVGDNAVAEGHIFGSMTRPAAGSSQTNGYAVSAAYAVSDRNDSYGIGLVDLADGFQTDVGFMTRTGVSTVNAFYQPKIFFDDPFFNRLSYGGNTLTTYDKASGLWETSTSLILSLLHRGNLTLQSQLTYSTEVFQLQRFQTSNVYVVWGGLINKWLAVSANVRFGKAIFYSASPFSGDTQRSFAQLTFQPTENFAAQYSLTYAQFQGDSTTSFNYSYPINRVRLTYQVNQYFFFRAITEYNGFRRRLPTDLLASFTYIPGTVLHLGYGTIHNRKEWDPISFSYIPGEKFLRMNEGLFFKASYLWRL